MQVPDLATGKSPVFECQGWTLSLRMKLALQMVTFFHMTNRGRPF